jgi:colanic acid biosynthesis glycosyl transferase WcaI
LHFLIVTQYYPPEIGAPQVRLRALAKALKDMGHEVEVVTALPNYPTGKVFPQYRGRLYCRETIDGIVVQRTWIYAAKGAGTRRMLNYLSFALSSFWALGTCKRPDFLFVESPPIFLSIPGYIMSRFWRTKMIFNVADLWPDSARELGLIENPWLLRMGGYLEKWSYNKSSKINAATQGIRQNLLAKGVPKSKILFLPNGVDIKLFKPQKADEKLSHNLKIDGKKVIIYAGNHGYVHGLDIILESAELLSNRPDIVFLLIGDGSEKRRLQELARARSLENVKFMDPAPPEFVARLYTMALAGLSTLLNLPLSEGVRPSKIFPPMASGVPVIYSGSGEGANLVQEAQAGIIIPPENPQAMAEGIKALADDPELARTLGENGRRYAEENFSWPTLIDNWLAQLVEKDGHQAKQ